MADLADQIERLKAEKKAMLECANLNPRETGNSIYMQLAIIADKKLNALLNASSAE